MSYRQVVGLSDQSIAIVEGRVNDVACYSLTGWHEDVDHILAHGCKLTEREARKLVSWPAHLTYRR